MALQNLPKLGFLGWKQTIWQPCFRGEKIWTLPRKSWWDDADFWASRDKSFLCCFVAPASAEWKSCFVSIKPSRLCVTKPVKMTRGGSQCCKTAGSNLSVKKLRIHLEVSRAQVFYLISLKARARMAKKFGKALWAQKCRSSGPKGLKIF
jgi:hypothetical protein